MGSAVGREMRGVAASGVHGWISNGRSYVYFIAFD
jgi:hypothetical protein